MPLAPTQSADLHHQRFPTRRSAVLGTRGMVATSQPLAASAALRALDAGGHAVDAAVTAAAALAVVEPTGCGLGGDCFALVYTRATGRVSAYDGSGRSPTALGRAEIATDGDSTMPRRGPAHRHRAWRGRSLAALDRRLRAPHARRCPRASHPLGRG